MSRTGSRVEHQLRECQLTNKCVWRKRWDVPIDTRVVVVERAAGSELGNHQHQMDDGHDRYMQHVCHKACQPASQEAHVEYVSFRRKMTGPRQQTERRPQVTGRRRDRE
jgi:hypothetical protein